MLVVVSLGGSIMASPAPNLKYIREFSGMLVKFQKMGTRVMVVIGGGKLAREYISAARKLGAGEKYCDEIGIAATRMNAMLLNSALCGASHSRGEYGRRALEKVPENIGKRFDSGKIFVMGGIEPGQTTDAVSAKLAAASKADLLVIATNVDGVYDSDPNKNPNAKKLTKLTAKELIRIVKQKKYMAGSTNVVDPVAAGVIEKKKLKTIVVDGRKIKNIENAILGKKHGGTVIN